MKTILIIISFIGLGLTIIPAILVFSGVIDLYDHKVLMFIGTILWFGTAPFWMGKKDSDQLSVNNE